MNQFRDPDIDQFETADGKAVSQAPRGVVHGWGLACAMYHSAELMGYLRDGWEPFSVVADQPADMVYLKKTVLWK